MKRVGQLTGLIPMFAILNSCTVMKKRVYLCFWFTDDLISSISGSTKKCMSAPGPTEQFARLESDSTYTHESTTIASNNRKILLPLYLTLATVNILAVGDKSHAKAELLTPDNKWTEIDDCPYGMFKAGAGKQSGFRVALRLQLRFALKSQCNSNIASSR